MSMSRAGVDRRRLRTQIGKGREGGDGDGQELVERGGPTEAVGLTGPVHLARTGELWPGRRASFPGTGCRMLGVCGSLPVLGIWKGWRSSEDVRASEKGPWICHRPVPG